MYYKYMTCIFFIYAMYFLCIYFCFDLYFYLICFIRDFSHAFWMLANKYSPTAYALIKTTDKERVNYLRKLI